MRFFDAHDSRVSPDDPHVSISRASVLVYRKGDRGKFGQTITFYRSGDDMLCPVQALLRAYRTAPHRAPSAPLFQHFDGRYVIPADVADILRRAAAALGLDASKFASHSLRKGGAQALRDAGFCESFIQEYGAWLSTANHRYHSMDPRTCVPVAAAMFSPRA